MIDTWPWKNTELPVEIDVWFHNVIHFIISKLSVLPLATCAENRHYPFLCPSAFYLFFCFVFFWVFLSFFF